MTSSEAQYDMGHAKEVLDGYIFSDTLRSRYLKSWSQWLAWCQDHGVQPGEAHRADVEQFISQLPGPNQSYIRQDISTIYARIGGANPARRLRPITADGRKKHDQRLASWKVWCELTSNNPLPADPEQLSAYLEEVASKKSWNYARRILGTISRQHSESGMPDPKRSPLVMRTMKTLRASAVRTVKPPRTRPGQSPQSIRRDQGIWRRWSKWGTQQGIDPMSARPEDLAAFLTEKGKTGKWDYVKLLYRSLMSTYQNNGAGNNPVDSDAVRDALHSLKQAGCPTAGGDSRTAPPEEIVGFPSDDELQHLAPTTRKTYRGYWRGWVKRCEEREVDPLVASPPGISDFLAAAACRQAVKSVEMYVAAIACVYDVTYPNGANPTRAMLVKRTMRGLKRKYGRPPAQMTGLSAEDFARIVATAKRPEPWEIERQALVRATTDLAIIGVMRDGLLRVSEAAALTWDDLEEMADGTGRLTIRRSKTDKAGEGAVVFVSRQTMGWLREMRALVMESLTIFGITRGSLYTRIIDAAQRAGLVGRYGGHSSRVGMTQDLARSNFTLLMIMQAGRWTSPQMPAHYIRKITASRNAVAVWYEQHPGRALLG